MVRLGDTLVQPIFYRFYRASSPLSLSTRELRVWEVITKQRDAKRRGAVFRRDPAGIRMYAAEQILYFLWQMLTIARGGKALSGGKNYLCCCLLELRTVPIRNPEPPQKAVILCQSRSEPLSDFSIFSPAEAAAHKSQGARVTSGLRGASATASLATLEF